MADRDHDEVHERALRRFDAIWSVEREERKQSLRDRRFEAIRGAMWEGQYALGDEQNEEDAAASARLEVPKFLRPIRRMRGEYRAARKTVDFKPKGDADRDDADNLDGLFRADANDSPAGPTAWADVGFNEGSAGGMGGWRLRAAYEDESDEKNECQRIRFEPAYDADQSMFFDIESKHQDRSDARFAFLLFNMSREAFEDAHPDASPATFEGLNERDSEYDWTRPDDLTLAEYFEVEDTSVLRRTFRLKAMEGIEGVEADEQTYDDAELTEEREGTTTLLAELRAKGYRQVRQRRIKRQRVRKYLLSGTEVLDDEGYIPGDQIPLVPFFFEFAVVQGVTRVQGMVRPIIDASRLLNIATSNVADTLAAPTDATPIVNPEQVDPGILQDWADRKVKRPAVLLLKPVYGEDGQILQAGVSGMLDPPAVSQAAAALLQFSDAAVADLMGETDRPEQVPANTSAQAIQLVNDAADVNDYLWHDNFALALARTGRIWLSMAKDLYVEPGRKMTAIDGEGKQSQITLADPDYDDGGQFNANDLTTGKYDVIVDVGPATKTRQDATVKSMLNIANVYAPLDPTKAAAATGVAVMSMEGEGIEGFRSFIRKQGLQEGWVEPNDEEKKALEAAAQQPPQPDPNMLLAQAQLVAAQAEVTKAETGRLEAETRRLIAEAQSEKARADAAAALAGINRADRKQILDEVKAETSSDRDDDRLHLDAAKTVADHSRESMRDLNGNAG